MSYAGDKKNDDDEKDGFFFLVVLFFFAVSSCLSISPLFLLSPFLLFPLTHQLRPQRPVPRPGSDPLPRPLLLRRRLRDRVRVQPALCQVVLLRDARVVRRRRGPDDAVELRKVGGAVARQEPRELRGGVGVGGFHEVDGDARSQGAKGQGERGRGGVVGEEELASGPGPDGREQAAEPARRRRRRRRRSRRRARSRRGRGKEQQLFSQGLVPSGGVLGRCIVSEEHAVARAYRGDRWLFFLFFF